MSSDVPGVHRSPSCSLVCVVDHESCRPAPITNRSSPPRAGAVVAAATFAALRLERALDPKVGQRVDALRRAQVHAAAEAAVAAVGPTERHELFAPEAEAAAATVAGLDSHLRFVDEFHGGSLAPGDSPPETKTPARGPGSGGTARGAVYSVTTLTKVRCSAPFFANVTLPVTSANSVWSVPTPTFGRRVRRTALPDQDVAGQHLLTAEALDAEAFRMRVAAVLGTAACLFVCHANYSGNVRRRRTSARADVGDLHFGKRAADESSGAGSACGGGTSRSLTLSPLPCDDRRGTLPPGSEGLPTLTSAPSPTSSTSPNSTVAPGSASSFSTLRTTVPSSRDTVCRPWR